MRTATSYRRTQIVRSFANEVEATDRYVDIGVTLKVVRADSSGVVLIEGARPMVVLREYHFGGIVDTKANPPRIREGDDGLSRNPQVWFCSEDQEKVIIHGDSETIGKLALGGMGAGKTTACIIWTYLRWLENLIWRAEAADRARERARDAGRDPDKARIPKQNEMGVTSPTEPRLIVVFNEIFAMLPPEWRSFNSETKIMTMCDGFRVRGVSTHRQSQSAGSRIQAFNWIAGFFDEIQDSVDEYIHMMARLRSKADGKAKRVATATAKDFPAWRALKDKMIASGDWLLHQLIGPSSPFAHPDHWERMARSMTLIEYRRLVLAEDLPSESRLYHAFDRKQNLRPIPIGARKITSIVLSRKTGDRRDAVLVGHDPGSAKAGSVWLDAYELPPKIAAQYGLLPNEVLWWARAELFTLHRTHEQHATEAMRLTRDRFGCNVRSDAERAHVRCQPLGQAEDKPDLDVLAIWRRIGFHIKCAQYSKQGTGVGQIKKESRIGVVNTLFCDAKGRRRLFIECDDKGNAACPQLLSAIETMERDDKGRPEHEEKNVREDKSDLPAGLGYGLWCFERELAVALRDDIRSSLN